MTLQRQIVKTANAHDPMCTLGVPRHEAQLFDVSRRIEAAQPPITALASSRRAPAGPHRDARPRWAEFLAASIEASDPGLVAHRFVATARHLSGRRRNHG